MKLGGVRLKIPIGGCFYKNWQKLKLLKSKGSNELYCQARDAVKDPEVNPVSSRERVGGVRRGFRALQWNVDGIGTSMADVISLVREDPGLDALLLQEIKLTPANPTPSLPGYSAIRHDR
jgi:hypothetical protein